MRIVAGDLRGRRLKPPTNLPVRPTTDFAKESLFNILRNRIDFNECCGLDLFCGTGSISFEFISRGMKQMTAIDSNIRCIDFINKTKEEFKVENLFTLRSDVFVFLGRSKMQYDVIFADPPYDMNNFNLVPELVLKSFLKPDGLFVLEHSREHSYTDNPFFVEHRNYGKVNFTFFKNTIKDPIL
jgi:16S rRNA (guanine966-N2)-methyltransferase